MRRFVFSLETLLRCKQLKQDRAAEEFNDARESQRRCCDELEEMRAKEKSLRRELKEQQRGRIDIEKLVLQAGYVGHMARSCRGKAEEAREKEREAECRRQELVAVLKDRKVLERLKEKQLAAFAREAAAIEQKDADENAVNRFARRSVHGR